MSVRVRGTRRLSLEETPPRDRDRIEPGAAAHTPARPPSVGARSRGAPPEAIWPVEPSAAHTNLPGRQRWHLSAGRAVAAEVGGARITAGDARISGLGVRRDRAGRLWPASFAYSPETGEALAPPVPVPEPDVLDIDAESGREITLPSGVPALARAGRPAGLYLFQENLGACEAWDGRGFSGMGRLPPADPRDGAILAAGGHGLAYAAHDRLVRVALPQLGPDLAYETAAAPGLRLVSAPCWRGADLLAIGARDGRLVLCRAAPGSAAPDLTDLDRPAGEVRFSGPWTNRLGDAFWTCPSGYVAWPAGTGEAAFAGWPDGFIALPAQAPWRDRGDLYHQLGIADGRYAYAAFGGPALQFLDGPHLAAGGVTYAGSERFDVPWQAPAEALNLGAHGGSLLVPLLALARDTVLLALPIEGPRAPFLRGEPLPAPVTGYALHHAHGAGLRRLPVGLAVSRLGDAGALLHESALYLWSRGERRCHALSLRA